MSWQDTLWDAALEASAQGSTFNEWVRQALDAFEQAKKDEFRAVHEAARKLDLRPLNNV